MASKDQLLKKVVLDALYTYYKEKLLIKKSAGEWLFQGINDKVLDFLKTITHLPFNKFGWFYGRNLSASFDGRFNVKTGSDNIYNLGVMERWNFVKKTNYYEGECGVVRGSSGELFSPIQNSQDGLSIFITDFCGPLTLKNSGPVSVKGLNGYHYVGDEMVFDNGTKNPSAKCFCTGECPPSGIRNVTSCRLAPLFISFPHFYLADPFYTEAVGGMFPNKTEHEFYLSLDPLSGIPLEVRAQLQLNVLLQPMSWCPMFADVPKLYIPMLWFRQRVSVSEELASRGRQLRIFHSLGLEVACSLAVLGVLVIIITACFTKFSSKNRNSEALISSGEAKEEESDSDR